MYTLLMHEILQRIHPEPEIDAVSSGNANRRTTAPDELQRIAPFYDPDDMILFIKDWRAASAWSDRCRVQE